MDRRSRQAQTTADRHFYKFISYYVRATHNEIYEEALALFTQAKVENPGVKDLVKTATYLRRAHPHARIPRYYNNRNLKSKQEPNLNNPKHMVLNIPLISIQPTRSFPSAELPPPEIAKSIPSEPAESTPPQLAESTLPEHTETTQVSTSPQLLLPTGIYEDLLKELQTDPELTRILNDFPIDSVNEKELQSDPELTRILNDFPIDSVNDFSTDSVLDNDMVWQDEISPLELEVQTMFDKTQ